ncbi:MAG: glycosyl transferase [Thelocarpon superellum]|nr:MAG: glycosyl transferase [Thelocarpon superellum]
MVELYPSISQCAIVSAALKVFKSTDFEVHRNWLAITHSLPVQEWYLEVRSAIYLYPDLRNTADRREQATSEWTLDYPPFFAYFEWLWSQAAPWADPALLVVDNLDYRSWATVCFQRATVILSELVLAYALHRFVQTSPVASKRTAHAIALSILLSPGLLIIDHIHFQYNGFLYGILVLSLVLARKQSTMLLSGVFFATLLCLKHIYLYLAPAYFVYLLRAFCLGRNSVFDLRIVNFIKLGASVAGVFALAFGPFVYWGQIPQLLSRLFPFSRGLCHAYWAPNAWALYSFADRLLLIGLAVDPTAVKSVTRGLVGDTSFAVLPEIAPSTTFLLTLASQMVCLVKLFVRPTWEGFIGAVTLCGYASFLFGWHVHEKAILLVLIPFSLLALKDRRYLGAFRPLAVAGHVSLFPLLFTPAEFPIKTIYTVVWLLVYLVTFDHLAPASTRPRLFLLDRFSLLYISIAIPLILYCSLVHELVFGAEYKFLPLMFISTYSAVGVVASWLGLSVVYFTA